MSAEHQEKQPRARFVKFEDLVVTDVQTCLPGWQLKIVRLQDIFPPEGLEEALKPFDVSLPIPMPGTLEVACQEPSGSI